MHIKLDTKVYPLEAILNACYVFLDRVYIFLNSDPRSRTIDVSFTSKQHMSSRQMNALKGSFSNELIHASLRFFVSQRNKNIREYIVGKALFSAVPQRLLPGAQTQSYKEDPLGIAIPWEEKYGQKEKKRRP